MNGTGTEAGAATMRATAMREELEPRLINADHPFLFLIRETATGSILFLGHVLEPGRG